MHIASTDTNTGTPAISFGSGTNKIFNYNDTEIIFRMGTQNVFKVRDNSIVADKPLQFGSANNAPQIFQKGYDSNNGGFKFQTRLNTTANAEAVIIDPEGSISTKANITASGNISASGDIIGVTGSFGDIIAFGNAGIGGAPDPGIKLHVKGEAGGSDGIFFLVENTQSGGEWVRFGAGLGGSSVKFSNTGIFGIQPVASKTDATNPTAFHMASDGKVGIGTSSPTEILSVAGNISASGDIITNNFSGSGIFISGSNGITLHTIRGGNSGSIKIYDLDTTGSIELAVRNQTVSGTPQELSGIFARRGNEGAETGYAGWSNQIGGSQQFYQGTRSNSFFQIAGTTKLTLSEDFVQISNTPKGFKISTNVTASGNISSSGKITANGVAFDFPNGYTLSSSQFASIDQLEHGNNFILKAHGNLALHGTNATVIKYGADNGANGWVVNSSGHFKPYSSDNTFDIGSTTTRPKQIFTRNLNVSGTLQFTNEYGSILHGLSLSNYNTVRVGGFNNSRVEIARHTSDGAGGVLATFNQNYGLDVSGSITTTVVDITPPVTTTTASLDCSLSNIFTLTLSGSETIHLTSSNIAPGQSISLRITQPATSGSLTYDDTFKFPNGAPYEVSATHSVEDIVSFISFDSTTLYGSSLKNFE